MKYKFYYDETEHSRVINESTVTADNYYDNFITVIVGWKENKESDIEHRYSAFEEKYADRKSKGEIKSTTLSTKQFSYGLASISKDNLLLINDFLNIFDSDIYLYFSVQSKLEYVVYQLLDGYENSLFADMDALKYSLIKAIHTYRPANVIDSIFNHPNDLVKQIRVFLLDRIEKNKANIDLKEQESNAFKQALILLEDVQELKSIDWDYHMPFAGFNLYLSEQGIKEYCLTIDKEGNKQKTLNAALDLGHIESYEVDSKDSFGIRIADFVAGIISKLMKSLSKALSSEYYEMQKVILDKKWFDLDEMQYKVYNKLHYVLSGINDCWYKSYAGVFADDLIVLIALLEYIDNNTVNGLKESLDMQGEYFNGYSIQCLAKHFDRIHNKLPVEPMTLEKKDFFINKWGAKVFVDASKQPALVIQNDHRECYVMNVGLDRSNIPTITIREHGAYSCYRISEQLIGWVQMLVGMASAGQSLLPSTVIFTIKDGKWYADIL